MRGKLAMYLGALLALYALTFFLPRLMPGDPFRYTSSVSGEDAGAELSEEQLAALRAYYGLDKPLPAQFRDTLCRNLTGDFGQSIHYKKPVLAVLRERLPWTLSIMGLSLGLSLLMGTFLALVGIRRRRRDRALYALLSALGEAPPYLVGFLLLFVVAARVDWLPLSGGATAFGSFDSGWARALDWARHALLPVASLCAVSVPGFYLTARASFQTALAAPYMLTARARGLREGRVRRAYILRNAISPIVAKLLVSVGASMGGAMLVENVFAYPGMGAALREAVRHRDYILIQGAFFFSALLSLAAMLAADAVNARADRGVRP